MTNRKIGATGLSILDIKPSTPPIKKKTATEMAKWCAELPMADIGVAAKKLYIALDEISKTEMSAQERYSVMELLRLPNKTICTVLKRHYIEQRAPLTEHKLIIANLRQSLLTAMADNYKLILEELHKKNSQAKEDIILMATSIVRIYYYLNVLLICRYQLYTYTPPNIWHEVHLLYKYAKSRNLLDLIVPSQFSPNNKTTILEAYTRIILLYATDPYQWRQREQHSLNKAIEFWALYPTIYEREQIPDKKPGIYIIDLDQDAPPTPYGFKTGPISNSCIALDVTKSVQHLKSILAKMQSNHLQAKIENPNDPEFSVTAPTIAKLINIWSQQVARSAPRLPIQAQIKIVFGLTAAHYYVNDEKEFNPHPSNMRTNFSDSKGRPLAASSNLPLYEVSEEDGDDEELPKVKNPEKLSLKGMEAGEEIVEENISKDQLYHIYDYNIENINPQGFGIVIRDKSYPPFQAGEIVAFKNISEDGLNWGIGAVRWLRRIKDDEFQIGIQIIAPYAKAAGIQMLRGDKPASRLLRCLVLPPAEESKTPPMLITTAFPLHSNSVMLYVDNSDPIKATLNKEIDASGMYYQYEYETESGVDIINRKLAEEKKAAGGDTGPDEEKTNTEFDSIWGDL